MSAGKLNINLAMNKNWEQTLSSDGELEDYIPPEKSDADGMSGMEDSLLQTEQRRWSPNSVEATAHSQEGGTAPSIDLTKMINHNLQCTINMLKLVMHLIQPRDCTNGSPQYTPSVHGKPHYRNRSRTGNLLLNKELRMHIQKLLRIDVSGPVGRWPMPETFQVIQFNEGRRYAVGPQAEEIKVDWFYADCSPWTFQCVVLLANDFLACCHHGDFPHLGVGISMPRITGYLKKYIMNLKRRFRKAAEGFVDFKECGDERGEDHVQK